ncbi:hypothetical protein NM688_g1588 [Phlebia brevispora]|uniref:Uncharacterized protein n=1 Tax=Phlebia brevispora TaxID=194682 RepID=A0ACC1TAV7_9APHY|nr:hypothetical protein NM688_g1588 [Phlebia brevispora]
MPYQKRPSTCSVSSNSSASSTSSAAPSSTPVTRPSGVLPLTPEIAEDEEDDPFISIGPEIIDENPFDPSIPDEVHFQMMKMRQAESQTSTPSSSIYDRLARMVPNHSVRSGTPEQRNGNGTWRSKFRFRRQSSEGDQDSTTRSSPRQRREAVPEPGVVLSCNINPRGRWSLVPLDAAQERGDIVRRPEGFEMDEQKRTGQIDG